MSKNNAIKTLNNKNDKKVVEVKILPKQYFKKYLHDWKVDIIILTNCLKVIRNSNIKILNSVDKHKLEKAVNLTECSGLQGIRYLSARPISQEEKK